MKKLFIVANWKSNKTIRETEEWLHKFHNGLVDDSKQILNNKEIIITPSFTALEHAHYCLDKLKLPIKFAAQNLSRFTDGAYTGEVSARQIKEVVDYVIVGHSERRKYFLEDQEMINTKIEQALKYELIPILCISEIAQISNSQLSTLNSQLVIAYEPLFAIGSGNPDTPENADKMARNIKKELGVIPILYGGSVSPENVRSFTKMPNIDGVLVGGASLNPLEFLEIVKNA